QLSTMTSKLRAFGTEISGNRRPSGELSGNIRSAIVAAHSSGKSKAELAHDFGVHRHTIDSTLDRWHNHHTVDSLSRTGRPELLTPRQVRLVLRI
ncbi:hypothetical protein QBC37DRAFT_268111, partial [Rhypophila decipiens]